MTTVEFAHPDLPDLVDALLEMRGWSWEQAYAGEAEHAGRKWNLTQMQEVLIYGDPVLFGETHLVEQPDNRTLGEAPLWRFFPYQKPSLRWRGSVMHQDGAEVGKTREIACLVLWHAIVNGSVLVGAPLDGHLGEIWEEIDWQFAASPVLADFRTKRSRVKPYRVCTLNYAIDFRPAGVAGEAFRGVHASAAGFFDELATVQNKQVVSEFMRAMKPRAVVRGYSVPNGVRTTPYFRLKEGAADFDPIMVPMSPRDIVRSTLGLKPEIPHRAALNDLQRLALDSGRRVYVKFHWPKTLMPAPWWSEERRLTYIEDFGGADSSGYVQNVLGLDGDPAQAVFPWSILERNLATLDDYRHVTLGVDRHDGRIDVEVRRTNPTYGPDRGVAGMVLDRRESIDLRSLETAEESVREAELERVFRPALVGIAGAADLVIGIDVGSYAAINVARVNEASFPPRLTLVARITLRGAESVWQRLVVQALDRALSPVWGWGIDATGAGASLYSELRSDHSRGFDDRMSPFVFNESIPWCDPTTGEQVLGPDDRPRSVMTKELGTQLLESAFGRAAFLLPKDDLLLHQFQSQVATIGANGKRKVSKGVDHDPDSCRCLILRLYERQFLSSGRSGPIVFHTPPAAAETAAGALPSPFDRGSATGGLLEGY